MDLSSVERRETQSSDISADADQDECVTVSSTLSAMAF